MTRHYSPQESPDNFARQVRIDQHQQQQQLLFDTVQIYTNTTDRVAQILKYIIMIKNLYLQGTEGVELYGRELVR